MARKLILINIFLSILLITLGGYVHNTGSSLACPDWPLCFGQIMPKMEGGVLIEHSHRLLASLVGFISILIVFFTRRNYPQKKKAQFFSWIVLALVIFQGVLGGLTVIYKLPSWISTTHLATSMIYISSLVYLLHITDLKSYEDLKGSVLNLNLKTIAIISTAILYIQIVLGALMRHLGLGGACGMGDENIIKCFDVVEFEKFWIPVSSQAQIHMTHRVLAVVVTILIVTIALKLINAMKAIKNSKDASLVRRLSLGAVSIVFIQVYLGIKTVSTGIDPMITTTHLTGATLLLIIMVKINLHLRRLELNIYNKISPSFISDLIDLTKPRLSALVILTATLGLFMAPGEITFFNGLISILATSALVAGACTINCYVEKDIDKLMTRTKNRPLPGGRLDSKVSLYIGIALIFVTLPLLYIYANLLTMILGIIATIFYIFIYTPMKLKSTWALFMGAIPGAMPPLMGWTTVTNNLDQMGLVLFGLLFIWQLPHFLAISIFHKEDYDNAGIQIVPTLEGIGPTKIRIYLYTLMLFAVVFLPLSINSLSKGYLWPALIVSGLFLILTFMGLIYNTDALNKKWAKNYFWGTLIYLPSILVIMLFFK